MTKRIVNPKTMNNFAAISFLCLFMLSTACQRKTEIITDWNSYIGLQSSLRL